MRRAKKLDPRRYVRCLKCENDVHPRVYSHPDAPGLQVRRLLAGKGLGNQGWEAVALTEVAGKRMTKINVLLLGRTSRGEVARAALRAMAALSEVP